MIHYTCPQCGEELESPDCLVGETETCPGCRTAVAVPASRTPAPSQFDVAEAAPPAPFDIGPAAEDFPPAPFEPRESAVDLAAPDTQEPANWEIEEPSSASTSAPPAPFAPRTSPPAPFEAPQGVAPGPGQAEEDDDLLGIFDDAPSAEDELKEQASGAMTPEAPATDKLPLDREAMSAVEPPARRRSRPMPPPSPARVDPSWGILEHARAAEREVTEEDQANVAAYAIGPQQPPQTDDEVSEEDVVTRIDIAALTAHADQHRAAPLQPAPRDDSAGVFIPGMPHEAPEAPVQAVTGQAPAPAASKGRTAVVKVKPPLPLMLLGGLKMLLAVLLAALVIVIGLVRGGTLSAGDYAFLHGLNSALPMTLLAANAAMLLLAGSGYMLLRPYGKLVGWFWIFQVFAVVGLEIALHLRSGTTVEEILQPGPLGLIAGSVSLAILSAAVLFACGKRFKRSATVQVIPDEPHDDLPASPPPLPPRG